MMNIIDVMAKRAGFRSPHCEFTRSAGYILNRLPNMCAFHHASLPLPFLCSAALDVTPLRARALGEDPHPHLHRSLRETPRQSIDRWLLPRMWQPAVVPQTYTKNLTNPGDP
jgi:hypothetical protein